MARKKQSHTQRLVDSMKTISTSATPITAAYQTGEDRTILPKDIQGKQRSRAGNGRILIPEDAGAARTEPNIASFSSYDTRSQTWNTRHPSYTRDISQYNTETSLYKDYINKLRRRNNALNKKTLQSQSQRKGGVARVMSKLKGSRGGLGRAGGIKGGTRT